MSHALLTAKIVTADVPVEARLAGMDILQGFGVVPRRTMPPRLNRLVGASEVGTRKAAAPAAGAAAGGEQVEEAAGGARAGTGQRILRRTRRRRRRRGGSLTDSGSGSGDDSSVSFKSPPPKRAATSRGPEAASYRYKRRSGSGHRSTMTTEVAAKRRDRA